MNKKFFTLMAAALVTGSVAAQTYDAGTDFEYRLGTTGYTNIVGSGANNPVLNPFLADGEHYLVEFFFIRPLFRFITNESSDSLDRL